jgi:hypothetical protein
VRISHRNLAAGMMVSNLTSSSSIAGACTQARSNVQLWPPTVTELLTNRDCWFQSMRLDYKDGRQVQQQQQQQQRCCCQQQ